MKSFGYAALLFGLCACGGSGDGRILDVVSDDMGVTVDLGPTFIDAGEPDPDGWRFELTPADFQVGSHLGFAIDSNDIEHIACRRYGSGELLYMRPMGGEYISEEVDAVTGSGYDVRIGIDADGKPFTAYFDEATNELRVARRSDAGWTISRVDTLDTAQSSEVAVVATSIPGSVGLAYSDPVHSRVFFAANNGTEIFTHVPVDESRDNYTQVGVQWRAGEEPRVLHRVPNSTVNAILLSQRGTESWTDVTSIPAFGGASFSFASNAAGDVFVAYAVASGTDDALRLSTLRHGETTWSTVVVDDTHYVGTAISLAVSASGEIGIAYYDWQQSDLYYAHGSPEHMEHSLVQAARHRVFRTFLAFDSYSRPHIAYQDFATNELRILLGPAP